MYRPGVKIALWTGCFTAGGYIKTLLDNPGNITFSDSLKAATFAVGVPVFVGAFLTGLGLSIKSLPNIIHKGKITLAEANDLDLMEDYKKSRAMHYFRVKSVIG